MYIEWTKEERQRSGNQKARGVSEERREGSWIEWKATWEHWEGEEDGGKSQKTEKNGELVEKAKTRKRLWCCTFSTKFLLVWCSIPSSLHYYCNIASSISSSGFNEIFRWIISSKFSLNRFQSVWLLLLVYGFQEFGYI